MVFYACVVGSSLIAFEAFVWPTEASIAIDKAVAALARKVWGIHAYFSTKGDHNKLRSKPNAHITEVWRIVPHHAEFVVRRLRWFRQMCLYLTDRAHRLCVLFGRTRLPAEEAQCSPEGCPTQTANPWLKQFDLDFDCLRSIDELEEFVTDLKQRYLLLLDPSSIWHEQFVLMDITILRSRANAVQVPPPDERTSVANEPSAPCAELIEFACSTVVCLAQDSQSVFLGFRSMAAHVRFAHRMRSQIHVLVMANRCCFCRSVL